MKIFDRKEKMDQMETFDFKGWHFLCSGEQLPSGLFHAAVRYRAPPDNQIRTLVLDAGKYEQASQALAYAKEIAMQWAHKHAGDGRVDA